METRSDSIQYQHTDVPLDTFFPDTPFTFYLLLLNHKQKVFSQKHGLAHTHFHPASSDYWLGSMWTALNWNKLHTQIIHPSTPSPNKKYYHLHPAP